MSYQTLTQELIFFLPSPDNSAELAPMPAAQASETGLHGQLTLALPLELEPAEAKLQLLLVGEHPEFLSGESFHSLQERFLIQPTDSDLVFELLETPTVKVSPLAAATPVQLTWDEIMPTGGQFNLETLGPVSQGATVDPFFAPQAGQSLDQIFDNASLSGSTSHYFDCMSAAYIDGNTLQ